MEHNNKEKKLINDAWRYLSYWADRTTGGSYRLNEALKKDKKKRGSITSSKALILRESLMYSKENPSIQSLHGTAEGILLGGLNGQKAIEAAKEYGQGKEHEGLLAKINEAIKAHQEAISRHLDSI